MYWLDGRMVGHWLWKPRQKRKRPRDPWGYAPGHSDQSLDVERIMPNTPKDALAA